MNMANKRSSRKKLLIFVFISLGVVLNFYLLLFVFIHESSTQHFGYDSELIDSLNIEHSLKKYVYRFYKEYLNYTKYDNYQTKLYYSIWEDKTLFASAEGDSSYSFLIEAKDDYLLLLDNTKEENVFIERDFDGNNYINIDNWYFEEIYCNLTEFTNEYYESSFSIRNPSFWLGYNPLTKEIQFSALVLKRMENLSKEELIMYFKLNFFCEKMADEKE